MSSNLEAGAKGFYVTFKDAGRTCWALGPFNEHQAAIDAVQPTASRLADLIPRSWWWLHGTASLTVDHWSCLPPGKLNDDPKLRHLIAAPPSAPISKS